MQNVSVSVIWCIVFLIIIKNLNHAKNLTAAHIIRKRKRKGANKMNEIVQNFIGKECLIYTMNGTSIEGIPETVKDGWMTVRSFDGSSTEAVNLEYVTRVREYPRDKKGKRKSVVLD